MKTTTYKVQEEEEIIKSILSVLTCTCTLHTNGKIAESNRMYEGVRQDVTTILQNTKTKISSFNSIMDHLGEDLDASLSPIARFTEPTAQVQNLKEAFGKPKTMQVVNTSDLFKKEKYFEGVMECILMNVHLNSGIKLSYGASHVDH